MIGPSVSTIIPAYRAAQTIQRAVDSVLRQTRRPDEILVVDDGSPDDIGAAVRQYGDKIRLLRKENGGAASARNLGIEEARGDLIAFLDADDYWEPNKIEIQLAVFRRHPTIGLCAGRFFRQTPGESRWLVPMIEDGLCDRVLTPEGAEAFELAMKIWTCVVVVRRDFLGDRRFPTDLRTAEDRDLWVRLALTGPLYFTHKALATGVVEAGSLSRSGVESDCANMLRVVRRYERVLGRHRRRFEAQVFGRLAGGLLSERRPREALVPACQRLVRQPLSIEGWWVFFKSARLTLSTGLRRPEP